MKSISLTLIILFFGMQILPAVSDPAVSDIQVSSVNPHYFEYKGKPVLLLGATHHNGWTPISVLERDFKPDLVRLADIIKESGNPNVRGLVRVIPYFPDYDGPQPWLKDNDGKYDLGKINPEWEKRLRDYLDLASRLEIIVSLELWDDWSITRGAGSSAPPGVAEWKAWGAHPFNPMNNINFSSAILPETTEVTDAPFYRTVPNRENIETVLTLQQFYANRLIEIAREYPNVLHNLSNETRATKAWSRYWVDFMRERVGEYRLIGEMPSTKWRTMLGESDSDLSPVALLDSTAYDYVDISQQVCQFVPSWESTPYEHVLGGAEAIGNLFSHMKTSGNIKPLLVSKHYMNTSPDGIPVLWGMIMSGAAGARFHRTGSGNVTNNENFQFNQVMYLSRFLKDVPFWKMRPDHSVVKSVPGESHTLALIEDGRHYIVLILNTAPGFLEIELSAGVYQAKWFDPATGEYLTDSLHIVMETKGVHTISIPDGKPNLVLHIKGE